MKASIISLAVLATAVSAQSFDGIPTCAQDCVKASVSSDGKIAGCQLIDIPCVCKNGGFLDTIGCCVSKACDAQGQAAVIAFANSICSGSGAVLPTKAECKPTQTGAASSSAGSSAAGSSAAGSSSTSSAGSASGSSTSAPAAAGSQSSTSGASAASPSSSKAAAPVAGPAGVFGAIAGLALAL